jgi:hypothetical protein
MAESINYGQDRSALALQYENLRKAVANRGEAENAREARDIERKGLFGTGIKSSDLQEFGNIAITGAELGDARMGKKMDRAEKSFGRRQAADERRLKTLQGREAKNTLTDQGKEELRALQYGMKERRDSFENLMGDYEKKGIFGTSFGGDDVGYRTPGESKWSKDNKLGEYKDGSGGQTDWSNLGDLGGDRKGRFAPEGDRIDRYSSYPHQPREFEKMEWEKLSEDDDIREKLKALEVPPPHLNVNQDGTPSNKFSQIFKDRRPLGLMNLGRN